MTEASSFTERQLCEAAANCSGVRLNSWCDRARISSAEGARGTSRGRASRPVAGVSLDDLPLRRDVDPLARPAPWPRLPDPATRLLAARDCWGGGLNPRPIVWGQSGVWSWVRDGRAAGQPGDDLES